MKDLIYYICGYFKHRFKFCDFCRYINKREKMFAKRDKEKLERKIKDNPICNKCNGMGQVDSFTTCPLCKRFGYLPKRRFK